MNISLTKHEIKALLNTLDMVLSIEGSIKKGDPDFEPLQKIWDKIISKST